jgi:hypothetical protein
MCRFFSSIVLCNNLLGECRDELPFFCREKDSLDAVVKKNLRSFGLQLEEFPFTLRGARRMVVFMAGVFPSVFKKLA